MNSKQCFRNLESGMNGEILFDPALLERGTIQHSDLFLKQGRQLLLRGDSTGIKFFEMASELDPENSNLHYDQGLSLFEYGNDVGREKNLLLAAKKFKKATKIAPDFFEAWLAWGNTLCKLGKIYNENHFFLEAKSKFDEAINHCSGKNDKLLADLYWNFALVMKEIAEISEEVSDLNHAVNAFQKAAKLRQDQPANFFQEFGEVYISLGLQINDSRLFLKAIDCFKEAISLTTSCYNHWYSLAEALTYLYEVSHDEDHFSQANECFATAAHLNPFDFHLWINWAGMLQESGKRLEDPKRLHSAIEKCHRAHTCEPNEQIAVAIWSESLSALGILTDRIDYINDAENKVCEVIDNGNPAPEIYHAFGMCLYSFAQYYNDLDYYYQAIEKFQEGLSVNRACHKLWFALGTAYAQAAELENDPEILRRSIKFYSKAIHFASISTYYYEYALALSKIGEFTSDKATVELAIMNFEQALSLQKNAIYLHPEWLFQYALTLDTLGDYTEDEACYLKAIEILSHVLVVDPDHPEVHHRLALSYSHYGEQCNETDVYLRSVHHFKLAAKRDDENDQILLDLALTLINLSEIAENQTDRELWLKEAEYKIIQAIKLGNASAYYHLACLYSLVGKCAQAVHFLEKAGSFNGLPPLEEILEDAWLEEVRSTSYFATFLDRLQAQDELRRDASA